MYNGIETVQDLIDALMKVKDKSKPIAYRGWLGKWEHSEEAPLSVEEHKELVEIE